MENVIKLLIVEDNKELCEILKDFFSMVKDIKLCGICHDGIEATKNVLYFNPDVIILDIIMPNFDGITFLEEMKTIKLERMPTIIVTSAISQEIVINKALGLGAGYYMIKPYNLSELLDRIRLMIKNNNSIGSDRTVYYDRIEQMITQKVIEIGVPTRNAGFRYIIDGVKMLTVNYNKTCPIVKEVYATIAQNHNTTNSCVESAIRKTIIKIYENKNYALDEILMISPNSFQKAPSNGEFLTLFAEKMKRSLY